MRNEFALNKAKPAKHRGGQRGNTNSRKDAHGGDEMATMDTALRARCKRMGLRPTDANLRIVKAACLETEAGRVIFQDALVNGTEVNQDRLAACSDIRNTFHTYWRLQGINPFPQNSNIQILPEEVFTDPDATPRQELTESQKADRYKALGNRKQKLITWIALGAGAHAEYFTNVITFDYKAKPGFIQQLDRVMEYIE